MLRCVVGRRYGTEHLLRLLCHLPNMLRDAKLPKASEDPLRLSNLPALETPMDPRQRPTVGS